MMLGKQCSPVLQDMEALLAHEWIALPDVRGTPAGGGGANILGGGTDKSGQDVIYDDRLERM